MDLGGYYDETTGVWKVETGDEWTPLTSDFTGLLDGLGHTITGLYINNSTATNQGLFGTLKGTVKNLSIEKSYIKAKNYVGSIAGKNEGTIENCYNTSSIIGETSVTGGYFKSITTGAQIEVWNDNVLTENAYFVSGSYTATAPKGFKVSKNVFEQTIEEGLVIQDADGNEFVWIPVTYTLSQGSQKDANELYPEFLAVFYRSAWDGNQRTSTLTTTSFPSSSKKWSDYTEPYSSGYTTPSTESADYYEMMRSVQKNKGFYIGRYEAGSQDTSGNPIARTDTTNGTAKVVVKQDQYPYNYVGWGLKMNDYTSDVTWNSKNQGKGALYLSKHMYDGENVGVSSTLCYSIQWDAMLDFIKGSEHNVTSARNWGNYHDNLWTITKITAKFTSSPESDTTWIQIPETGKTKTSSEYTILTTGADDNFVAKNIYDVAGNVAEWVNEADSSIWRVIRGGSYGDGGSDNPASGRTEGTPNYSDTGLGFRPSLYIK